MKKQIKKQIKKQPREEAPKVLVQNCVFKGVEFDAGTIETIKIVAEGLKNITELFKANNIQIETLLKIHNGGK